MAEETKTEKAFIVRWTKDEGFKFDPVGNDLPTQEMVAMMDACQRQYLHGRLRALEEAVLTHSAMLKQIMTLLSDNTEPEDSSAADEVVEED